MKKITREKISSNGEDQDANVAVKRREGKAEVKARPSQQEQELDGRANRNNKVIIRLIQEPHNEESKENGIKCQYEGCGRVLADRFSLSKHVKSKHKDLPKIQRQRMDKERTVECTQCGRQYTSKDSFRKHKCPYNVDKVKVIATNGNIILKLEPKRYLEEQRSDYQNREASGASSKQSLLKKRQAGSSQHLQLEMQQEDESMQEIMQLQNQSVLPEQSQSLIQQREVEEAEKSEVVASNEPNEEVIIIDEDLDAFQDQEPLMATSAQQAAAEVKANIRNSPHLSLVQRRRFDTGVDKEFKESLFKDIEAKEQQVGIQQGLTKTKYLEDNEDSSSIDQRGQWTYAMLKVKYKKVLNLPTSRPLVDVGKRRRARRESSDIDLDQISSDKYEESSSLDLSSSIFLCQMLIGSSNRSRGPTIRSRDLSPHQREAIEEKEENLVEEINYNICPPNDNVCPPPTDNICPGTDNIFPPTDNICPCTDNIFPCQNIKVATDNIQISGRGVSIKDTEPALKQQPEALEREGIGKVSDKLVKAMIEINDAANFNAEFINKFYSIMTAETLIMWPLIKLPDPKYKPFQSTRSQLEIKQDAMITEGRVSLTYGEATRGTIEKIVETFQQLGLKDDASFLDIGSGFGKVVYHVAALTGCHCYGQEISEARYQYSVNFKERLQQIARQQQHQHKAKIEDLVSKVQFQRVNSGLQNNYIDINGKDITHIYSFNARFTQENHQDIAKALANTRFHVLAWCLSKQETYNLGLKSLQLIENLFVSMEGSNQKLSIYIYWNPADKHEEEKFTSNELGLSGKVLAQISAKERRQSKSKQATLEEIEKESVQAKLMELRDLSKFLSINFISLSNRLSFLLENVITAADKYFKDKQSKFKTRAQIIAGLNNIIVATNNQWFIIKKINGLDYIVKQKCIEGYQLTDFDKMLCDYYINSSLALEARRDSESKQYIKKMICSIQENYNEKKTERDAHLLTVKLFNQNYELQQPSEPTVEQLVTLSTRFTDQERRISCEQLNTASYATLANALKNLFFVKTQLASIANYIALKAEELRIAESQILIAQKYQKKYSWQVETIIRKELEQKLRAKSCKQLGLGSFGRVFYLRNSMRNLLLCPKKDCAVKVYINTKKLFDEELANLQKIRSQKEGNYNKQFIVELYSNFTVLNGIGHCLALEYVDQTLQSVLTKKVELSFYQKRYIALYMLRGLNFAHCAQIPHRDIKPVNILLTADLIPKICDWGFSPQGVRVGTPSYMAPELFRVIEDQIHHGLDLKKADAWSTGITLYQLFTGIDSFKMNEQKLIELETTNTKLQLAQTEQLNEDTKDLLDRLLETNPEKRLSIAQAIHHQLFKDLKVFQENLDISKLKDPLGLSGAISH